MNPLVIVPVLLTALTVLDSGLIRTDYELCMEVTEEVNLQVRTGLLTQFEADQISHRCFTQFAS